MKTINGALKDLAIKLNEKLGGEPLNDSQVKSVTGYLQQIAGILSDDASNAETLTGVTAIESIADAVENIDIGGGDIGKALIERSIAGNVVVPKGITKVGRYAFYGCTEITEIYLPQGVTEIDLYAFSGCLKLKTLKVPESCTYIDNSVANSLGCPLLEYADFPGVTEVGGNGGGFGGVGVNSQNGLIIWFNALETVPNGLFSGSYATKVYLPSAVTIGNSFQGISKLEEVYIGPDCTSIESGAFGGAKSGVVINCGFAEGAVSGAPWAAQNATINYNVPVPNVED